ncbi:hypothetical protein DFH11DRAFT_1630426 [Phellopilus nigrolimitatus]|nr:hypothetical protein DFH11DRAFT_1630426 [Phellopilus nigrolimitatus]
MAFYTYPPHNSDNYLSFPENPTDPSFNSTAVPEVQFPLLFNGEGILQPCLEHAHSTPNDDSHAFSMKHHQPTLQTVNLPLSSAFVDISGNSFVAGYRSPLETPHSHILAHHSAVVSPENSTLYSNCSPADSMVSFSSSTSGELDPPDSGFAGQGNFNSDMFSPNSPTALQSRLDEWEQQQSPAAAGDESAIDTDQSACDFNNNNPKPKKHGSRRMWPHKLENVLFTPHEIATLGTPHRRTIYLASLEAHIDRLHSQLLGLGLYPIPVEELQPYKGLNCKTAKGMVSGLQHDFAEVRAQMLEIDCAENNARSIASMRRNHELLGSGSFSLDHR